MNCGEKYLPTEGDVLNMLRLLYDNGINVQNSKKAYEELQQYQANPFFCILLSHVFGSESCPIQNLQLSGSWIQYRRLAGITLKNNLEKAKHTLGLEAVKESASCALSVLANPLDPGIARVAAQIVIKITTITSLEWWDECGIGNLSNLLLNDLLKAGKLKTLSALYTLQYLMEDLPKGVGAGSKEIVESVLILFLDQNTEANIRKSAFKMCFNIYEQAEQLDWNVELLSPLQSGLAGASGAFASTCTRLLEEGCGNDIHMLIYVLHSCVLLLEYLDHFTPMPPEEMDRMINWWICRTIDLVCFGDAVREHDIRLKIVAMNLLTSSMKLYDRMGGEGYISLFVRPIFQKLPVFISALVSFVPMSKDEIDGVLSNDDYRLRDTTPVNCYSAEKNKDIFEESFLDDDCGSATLRSTALRCIDTLCFFANKEAFPHLMEHVYAMWNGDRQFKEAAFVLIGTIASGCYNEIEPFLANVVSHLVNAAASMSEDIFVVSIAIWSLSRILEWAYTQDGKVLDDILKAFLLRLESNSKRVQQAAASALNTAFTVAYDMGTIEKLVYIFQSLARSIVSCLPIYCDTNLSLLCDLVLHMIPSGADDGIISQLGTAFKENRIERTKLFEASYVTAYINEVPNALVDKDIFSIDRVIVGLLMKFPDSGFSINILNTWLTVLKDIVERLLTDDVDLLYSVMYACSNFVKVTSAADLTMWLSQTGHSLVTLAFQFLFDSKHQMVKSASINLLYDLLKNIGRPAFSDVICTKLLAKLASSVSETDDPHEKLELVRLISLMIQTFYFDIPDDCLRAFQAAVGALRSDAYYESRWFFEQMTYDICRIFEIVPKLIFQSRLHEIIQIMAQAENTYEKSVATVQLVNALLLGEESALAILPSTMHLICSWQQAACNFPGTQERLKSLLLFYNSRLGGKLREQLNGLHPNVRQMLLLTYDINEETLISNGV